VVGDEIARWYADRERRIEVVDECWTMEKRL
jgi:hypothetical protein